jgi:hypothetical protein
MAKRLFEEAEAPKQFFTIQGYQHDEGLTPEVHEAIQEFLAKQAPQNHDR